MKIVIDFGAIAHAVRRWFWRVRGSRASETQCLDCGKELTRDEAHYYAWSCERCEGINSLRWHL